MKQKKHPLRYYFILECSLIVIFSVCTFELIEFAKNYTLLGTHSSDELVGIGMIAPMSLVIGLFMTHLSKTLYQYLSKVTDGLEKVASGDFQIYLDTKHAGPFPDVYENFNHMVAELNSVQTLRDDFINNFSHEFKTPISSIHGFAELLLDESFPIEEQRKYLKIIAKESDRLAELANQTLLFSKLNSQVSIPDKCPYSLDEQLKQCAILLSSQWEAKQISFEADLEEITYFGNASIMQHIWINILQNAIKFTPLNGEIELKLYKKHSLIHVIVRDSGIGMDEETKQHMFQQYYQGTTKQASNGLGLGLSIALKIITLCNGKIQVNSQLNMGTTIDISLPEKNPSL